MTSITENTLFYYNGMFQNITVESEINTPNISTKKISSELFTSSNSNITMDKPINNISNDYSTIKNINSEDINSKTLKAEDSELTTATIGTLNTTNFKQDVLETLTAEDLTVKNDFNMNENNINNASSFTTKYNDYTTEEKTRASINPSTFEIGSGYHRFRYSIGQYAGVLGRGYKTLIYDNRIEQWKNDDHTDIYYDYIKTKTGTFLTSLVAPQITASKTLYINDTLTGEGTTVNLSKAEANFLSLTVPTINGDNITATLLTIPEINGTIKENDETTTLNIKAQKTTLQDIEVKGGLTIDKSTTLRNLTASGFSTFRTVNITGTITCPTPTADTQAANKKYVDDQIKGYTPIIPTSFDTIKLYDVLPLDEQNEINIIAPTLKVQGNLKVIQGYAYVQDVDGTSDEAVPNMLTVSTALNAYKTSYIDPLEKRIITNETKIAALKSIIDLTMYIEVAYTYDTTRTVKTKNITCKLIKDHTGSYFVQVPTFNFNDISVPYELDDDYTVSIHMRISDFTVGSTKYIQAQGFNHHFKIMPKDDLQDINFNISFTNYNKSIINSTYSIYLYINTTKYLPLFKTYYTQSELNKSSNSDLLTTISSKFPSLKDKFISSGSAEVLQSVAIYSPVEIPGFNIPVVPISNFILNDIGLD